jgi:site-specific DNA recombinase
MKQATHQSKKTSTESDARAAIYLRVSTDEQAEQYGMDLQRRKCTELCSMKSWEVTAVYEDPGYSGATMQRPGLQQLLEDSLNGKWDVVVVYKVDRLSRSTRNLLAICEDYLRPNEKDLASCMESIDTHTTMGRSFLNILAVFAEMERETIRERTDGGRWEAARKGVWAAGGVPFGYRKEKLPDDRKVLVIEEQEAEVVRRMFEWHVSEGIGSPAIAERLNTMGIPTPSRVRGESRQGQFWQGSQVGRMLANTLYMGEGYLHRYQGRMARRQHPRETWIPIEVPAIVSRRTFQKGQRIRANNRRVSGGQSKVIQPYLLRDVLYCGSCGAHMRGMHSNSGSYARRYYRCGRQARQRISDQGNRCELPYIPAAPLEEVVWQQVRGAILDPDSLETLAKLDDVDVEQIRRDVASLEARIAEIEKQRERLRWLFTSQTISFEELESDLSTLDRQRRDVQERKASLETKLVQQEDLTARLQTLYRLLEALRSKVDGQRALLSDMGLRVTVQPDRSVCISALIPVPESGEFVAPKEVARRLSPHTPPSDPASRRSQDGRARRHTPAPHRCPSRPGWPCPTRSRPARRERAAARPSCRRQCRPSPARGPHRLPSAPGPPRGQGGSACHRSLLLPHARPRTRCSRTPSWWWARQRGTMAPPALAAPHHLPTPARYRPPSGRA